MELIHKLGIDWKILIAQIINFFILLAILYKFVYKQVLNALEKRSKTIEKGLRDAKESEVRLVEIEDARKIRLAETEREVGRLLEKARHDAEILKKDFVAVTQAQSEDLLRRSRLQIVEEKQRMIEEVKVEVSNFVIALTGKLLQREFSAADQKRLAETIAEESKTVL